MVLINDFLMTTNFIFIIILYFLLSFYKLFKIADGFTWTFGYYPNIDIPFWIIQSHSNKKT